MANSLMGHHAEVKVSADLVPAIEHLYDEAISAVQMKGSTGEWFRTTVAVGHGCRVSPHPPSSKCFSKGFFLMLCKNMVERLAQAVGLLPIFGVPMTLTLLLRKRSS